LKNLQQRELRFAQYVRKTKMSGVICAGVISRQKQEAEQKYVMRDFGKNAKMSMIGNYKGEIKARPNKLFIFCIGVIAGILLCTLINIL
jgi:hypothetical protein